MSFNRLNYDTCTYKQNLKQSVGVGGYGVGTPRLDCHTCFPADPSIQMGQSHIGPITKGVGGSTCVDKPLVDVSSELLGITRQATNCPTGKFMPKDAEFCEYQHPDMCPAMTSEDTRLSNPPCTLRSTGWNRWEWLCQDPQSRVLIPFDYNINYRLVSKDNHRPCIPRPINQADALPPMNASDYVHTAAPSQCPPQNAQEHIPSVHWKKCSSYYS